MIYFDNAASTPVHPEIIDIYTKLLSQSYANQGSAHKEGLEVNRLVNKSKQNILELFGLDDQGYQVVFTSGATEANNLFLKGAALNYRNRGNKIIISAGEHPSVLKPLLRLQKDYDFKLEILPLNEQGIVEPLDLAKAIDEKTIIVSIMAVNNQTGAINKLDELAKIVKKFPKCLFHSDVTQAVAKTKIDYALLDAFSFSAHKINGLKGSGALILKKSISLIPLQEGGVYEYGFRDGTPDSPKNIVLAKTIKLAFDNYKNKLEDIEKIHEKITAFIISNPQFVVLNSPKLSVAHIINFSLLNHRASIIANGLSSKNIMVGTSSACSSKLHENSHVIMAMFNDEKRASNVIRISFGYFNHSEEVDVMLKELEILLRKTKYE